MRKPFLIGLIGAAVVLATASISLSQNPATTQNDLARENAKLRAEIDRLKRENQLLRQTLADHLRGPANRPFEGRIDPDLVPSPFRDRLERAPDTFRFRIPDRRGATTRPFTLIVPDGNSIPRDWVRREFNGQPFYLIPLADNQRIQRDR